MKSNISYMWVVTTNVDMSGFFNDLRLNLLCGVSKFFQMVYRMYRQLWEHFRCYYFAKWNNRGHIFLWKKFETAKSASSSSQSTLFIMIWDPILYNTSNRIPDELTSQSFPSRNIVRTIPQSIMSIVRV